MKRRWTKALSPRVTRMLWDAHSLAGVVCGVAIHIIFLAGALALYAGPIRVWEDPGLRDDYLWLREASRPIGPSLDSAVVPRLSRSDAGAFEDFYLLMPTADKPFLALTHADSLGVVTTSERIDVIDGDATPIPASTDVAGILTRLHYFDQITYPFGRTLSGVIAVVLAFSIITGLAIRLPKLVSAFLTFRPWKARRIAAADAHSVLGVLGLPFQLMYAVTGAFYGLVTLLLIPTVLVVFKGDAEAVDVLAAGGGHVHAEPGGRAPVSMGLAELLERAEATAWDGFEPMFVHVHDYGDVNGQIEVTGTIHAPFPISAVVTLSTVTGEELARGDPETALPTTLRAIAALHFGTFARGAGKPLFVILALLTCAVVLTGQLVWLDLRRNTVDAPPRRLHGWLAHGTVGVSAGMIPAIAILFASAMLLPGPIPGRAVREETIFFIAWLGFAAVPFLVRDARRGLVTLAMCGGVLLLGLPLVNGLVTGHWPWITVSSGLWPVLGVDLAATLCGLALLLAALRVHRRAVPSAAVRLAQHRTRQPTSRQLAPVARERGVWMHGVEANRGIGPSKLRCRHNSPRCRSRRRNWENAYYPSQGHNAS